MTNYSSIGAYASQVRAFRAAMSGPEATAVTRAQGEWGAEVAKREARRDLGGDTRFSGWPGVDLADLQVRPLRTSPAALLSPTPMSAAGWTVAESGRNRGRRVGRRWNGVTPAKHTATRAVAAMEVEAQQVAEDCVHKIVRTYFGG